jgi:hypothetical protein
MGTWERNYRAGDAVVQQHSADKEPPPRRPDDAQHWRRRPATLTATHNTARRRSTDPEPANTAPTDRATRAFVASRRWLRLRAAAARPSE